MRNYKQTKIIFEKILIKKPYLIAVKLHYDSPILQNIPFESKINTNLIGGSKKINVLFKSIDYVFHVYREDEYIYYNLHQ